MCERELTEREMAIEKEFQERKDREESKTVKPANTLVEVIGETLERIHAVPSDTPKTEAGYKSIVLCFGNGKSIHLDAEMHLCKDGVFPTITSRDGDWEMVEAAPEPGTPDLSKLDGRGLNTKTDRPADLHEIDGANQN